MEPRDDSDAGIGMIEIVVSMFILAILALSFLPVLTQGAVASQKNTEVSVATQLVSTEMEIARSQSGTCASVLVFANSTPTVTTVQGRSYDVIRTTPSTCTAPGSAVVTVSVRRTGTTAVLASAQTRLYVGPTT